MIAIILFSPPPYPCFTHILVLISHKRACAQEREYAHTRSYKQTSPLLSLGRPCVTRSRGLLACSPSTRALAHLGSFDFSPRFIFLFFFFPSSLFSSYRSLSSSHKCVFARKGAVYPHCGCILAFKFFSVNPLYTSLVLLKLTSLFFLTLCVRFLSFIVFEIYGKSNTDPERGKGSELSIDILDLVVGRSILRLVKLNA